MTKPSTVISCREPKRTEWFRVRPGLESVTTTGAVRDPDTGVLYLLHGELWSRVGRGVDWICPRVCVNNAGQVFLWPVPMPGPEAEWSPWFPAGQAVASLAEATWVRAEIDTRNREYRVETASGRDLPEPVWPPSDYLELMHAAFHGRVIDSIAHPLIRKGGGL